MLEVAFAKIASREKKEDNVPVMSNKRYVLLSGCNGGIGKKTTQRLLQEGYAVIGLDLVDPKIDDPSFSFIPTDITDLKQIELAKEAIQKITPKLDAILNLAGIFRMQSMLEGKEEDLRQILEVNFFSVYRLNKAFFDLLESKARIVVFSSEVARYSPQPFNGYYALSKHLVDTYADILRREMNYLDIKVIKVQSGAIKTGLLSGVDGKYQEMVASSKYYKEPLRKLKKLMDNETEKNASPEIIANLMAKILRSKHPKRLYKIKNSFSLRFLDFLPEGIQDIIYRNVIK